MHGGGQSAGAMPGGCCGENVQDVQSALSELIRKSCKLLVGSVLPMHLLS